MSLLLHDRRAFAIAVALGLTVACSGDTILGPPDGAACTRGTISIGELHEGELDVDDCLLLEDYEDLVSQAESWTLHAKANTAYIVRMLPVGVGAANTLDGSIVLYRRNSAGDAVYASGYWGNLGAANVSGGTGKEMYFTAAQDETVSLRVQAWSKDIELGAYTIEVLTCDVVTLTSGATSAPYMFTPDCAVMTGGAQAETPVRFFNFASAASNNITLTTTRTTGTSTMLVRVGGPDFDFGCYTGNCTFAQSTTAAGPIVLNSNNDIAGYFTVVVFQQTVGTLTATVGLTLVPAP